MIDLYTAIKLCDIKENEIVTLTSFKQNNKIFCTKKEIFNKLDTRKIKVIKIDTDIDYNFIFNCKNL